MWSTRRQFRTEPFAVGEMLEIEGEIDGEPSALSARCSRRGRAAARSRSGRVFSVSSQKVASEIAQGYARAVLCLEYGPHKTRNFSPCSSACCRLPSPAAFSSPAPRPSPTTRKTRTKARSPSPAWSRSPRMRPTSFCCPHTSTDSSSILLARCRPRPRRPPPRTTRKSTSLESIATARPASSTCATATPGYSFSTTGFRTSSRFACPSTSTRYGSARATIASAGATNIAWPTSGLR